MKKYYTRACNFFYGSNSKKLVKKKLPYLYVVINQYHLTKLKFLSKRKKKVNSKIINIKNIHKLPLEEKKKISKDIKKITSKRKLLRKKNHMIMGILNMTPDSFSDGGKFNSLKKAFQRNKRNDESWGRNY